MAYVAGRLFTTQAAPPGRALYRYDTDNTVDQVDDVEAAGFFSNKDDDLNLQIGDRIDVFSWSGVPFASGSTLVNALQLVVTNVIPLDAAANAGNVNTAQVFLTTSLFSSLL
jgi:hypothetical protein